MMPKNLETTSKKLQEIKLRLQLKTKFIASKEITLLINELLLIIENHN